METVIGGLKAEIADVYFSHGVAEHKNIKRGHVDQVKNAIFIGGRVYSTGPTLRQVYLT